MPLSLLQQSLLKSGCVVTILPLQSEGMPLTLTAAVALVCGKSLCLCLAPIIRESVVVSAGTSAETNAEPTYAVTIGASGTPFALCCHWGRFPPTCVLLIEAVPRAALHG